MKRFSYDLHNRILVYIPWFDPYTKRMCRLDVIGRTKSMQHHIQIKIWLLQLLNNIVNVIWTVTLICNESVISLTTLIFFSLDLKKKYKEKPLDSKVLIALAGLGWGDIQIPYNPLSKEDVWKNVKKLWEDFLQKLLYE